MPLALGEEYELAIKSIDIDGNKAYVELSKNGKTVDSAVVIIPAPALYNKGLDLFYQGQYDEAVKAYDKVIEIDPQYAPAWINMGSALDELGKHEEASEAYDKAIEIDPQYAAYALYHKGLNHFYQGKYIEAIKAYDKAIELDPKDALLWNDKGNALRELGEFDDALIAYNKAIKLDSKEISAWFGKGYVLNRLGEYTGSVEAYEEAIKLNPQDAAAWNNKGVALGNQDKYDEAVKAYDKAIELDPQDALFWNNKGNALDTLGKFDEAIKSYNKASAIDASISILSKGNEHYNRGEYTAAIRYYEESIRQDPKDKNAWYNKADALRMLHRNSEAEAAYAKARELGYNGTMTLMEMTTNN